jgi:hypothetical protein
VTIERSNLLRARVDDECNGDFSTTIAWTLLNRLPLIISEVGQLRFFSFSVSACREAKVWSQLLIGDDLQQRIVAQSVWRRWRLRSRRRSAKCPDAVVAAGCAIVLTPIADPRGQVAGQMMVLIEGSQRQTSVVAGDRTAGEVCANERMTVERETQLWGG